MPIFIPAEHVTEDNSFGQVVNRLRKEYIDPELKLRSIETFAAAGIEIHGKEHRVYLDDEVSIEIDFKERKIQPPDAGKPISLKLQEIKDISWHDAAINKASAKILLIHFNKNWWILKADLGKQKHLKEKLEYKQTWKVRGSSYLPLNLRRQEKETTLKQWRNNFEKDLPSVWKRHVTISQRYNGLIVYDGNYYDLFLEAQNHYILGNFFVAILLCRAAAEQALIRILLKSGKGFDIYKKNDGKKLKSIEELVRACRSYSLFKSKYPLSKIAAKKLNALSNIASDLVHPKVELDEMNKYKDKALHCMDIIHLVIKKHLNFVKDTGTLSGYRPSGQVKRLK